MLSFADLGVKGLRMRTSRRGDFLTAVALQRQPYLSVDNLRPTGTELRRVGRFRDEGVMGFRG